MRVRNAVPLLVLVLLLGLLAGFAWLSRHPEDPRVAAAEEWPVIGPVVARVRTAFLPPKEEAQPGARDADRPTEILVRAVPAPPEEPGVPAETEVAESVWVAPETPLRAAPRLDAPVLLTIDQYTEIPVFERLPAQPRAGEERPAFWLEVWHRGRTAWIRQVEPPLGEPPLGRKPEPVLPLESLEPDPERLALALDLLGSRRASGRLGPYVLYTDVTDPYLLQRLSAVAEQIETGLVAQPGDPALPRPAGRGEQDRTLATTARAGRKGGQARSKLGRTGLGEAGTDRGGRGGMDDRDRGKGCPARSSGGEELRGVGRSLERVEDLRPELGVAPTAGQQALILEPCDRLAQCELTHVSPFSASASPAAAFLAITGRAARDVGSNLAQLAEFGQAKHS